MGKNEKSRKSKSGKANTSSGSRRSLEEASEINRALFQHSRQDFQWESQFDQEHSQGELKNLLSTKPNEFKHCKLKMERDDLAYAKPLDDPNSAICIRGREYIGRSFPGDEVCVQILSPEFQPHQGESVKGKVVGLIQRSEKSCTFVCRMEGHKKLVSPVKKNMTRICIIQKEPDKIEIRKLNPQSGYWFTEKCIDTAPDQLLVVRVLKWEKKCKFPLGAVTKVMSQNEYVSELLELEYSVKGTPPSFDSDCDEEEVEREDFQAYRTFTIDKKKAQDLDDAFSLYDNEEQYVIVIHITDVASYLSKDSEEDKFAKEQGRTIYLPDDQANPDKKQNTAFMLSRDLSYNKLSLRQGETRNAISLKVMINKANSMIDSSSFTLSHIKSGRRLSYEEADTIIQERGLDYTEAPLKFSTVEDCVAVAYCFSKVLRKFRLEGSWSSGQRNGASRAVCMVEELMYFYNSAVAEKLISEDLTRDLTPLRCHFEPDPGLLEHFKMKYSNLIPISSYLSQICEAEFKENKAKDFIHVLKPVLQKMKDLAEKRDYHELVHLIISDEIHPTLHHMAKEFKEIQNKAVIRRSCSNLSSKLGHYDLQLNAYTWASSPMRRYIDVILQRLLHNVLSEKRQLMMDYTKAEIDHFCDQCETTEDFDLELLRFITVIKSCSRDVTKLAVVEKLFPNQHEFFISIPLDSLSQLMIKYRDLKVVEQPDYNHQDNSCILTWKRRVYSFGTIDKPPPKIHKNVVSISVKNWTKMISAVKGENWDEVSECLQHMTDSDIESKVNLNDSNEHGLNKKTHFKEWKMELKEEEVLQVQLGTDVINGATLPTVNFLTVSTNFEVCLEHARNPIKCFTHDTECCASKPKYRSHKEYQEIWEKICQMDTAYNAVEENNSVILEDVSITWTDTAETLKGYFIMTKTNIKDWSLEFNLTNCYLCIRLRDQCAEKEEETKATQSNGLSDLQNTLPLTWVAHGVPIKSQSHEKENTSKTNQKSSSIKVRFQINHHNMTNVPSTLQKKETKFTVEVIPKKIPYVQYEHAIHSITKANNLVKSIATGTVFGLFSKPEKHNFVACTDELPILNESQERAVQEALNNPFTVIQGPPGTGKTVVGLHITYHFCMKNNVPPLAQDISLNKEKTKKRGILYCGPSNKSVDIVAEQLLKLRGVLKPLRIYCDQMEMRAFPYPGSELKLCRRSLRDERPKEVLRDISLMYLVRQPGNPYSVHLENLEKMDPEEFSYKSYKEVLMKAQKHELQKHDVILCTCSTALKPILMETMDFRQILIDECAMATEPEAFIPLVSHKPEQIVLLGDHKQIQPIVTCARVKDLGMEKSLFERYMKHALMLDTQYRMHESICEFPSNEFYGGKLKTRPKQRDCLLLDKNKSPTAILFGHVEGEEISLSVSTTAGNEHSAANEREAKQAVRVAKLLISQSRVKPEDVAILTPYNAQMSKIKEMLSQEQNKAIRDVSVFTVMKSQGSEWRYVIISTVRSCKPSEIEKEQHMSKGWLGRKLGFVTDPNQVNVAITRAQDGLCILGNRHLLDCSNLWRKLLTHYQKQHCVMDAAEDIKVVTRS